ncbi:chondrolectin, partial [Lates japonicus]
RRLEGVVKHTTTNGESALRSYPFGRASGMLLVYVIIPTIPLLLLILVASGTCCFQMLSRRTPKPDSMGSDVTVTSDDISRHQEDDITSRLSQSPYLSHIGKAIRDLLGSEPPSGGDELLVNVHLVAKCIHSTSIKQWRRPPPSSCL